MQGGPLYPFITSFGTIVQYHRQDIDSDMIRCKILHLLKTPSRPHSLLPNANPRPGLFETPIGSLFEDFHYFMNMM